MIEPDINVVVFRQNTEGLYSGVEWLNPPEKIRSALETHPKMASFKPTPGEDHGDLLPNHHAQRMPQNHHRGVSLCPPLGI